MPPTADGVPPHPATEVEMAAGHVESTASMRPNVVYLHTFKPTPHVYNISPFAIKVESFLRIHAIPYETVYTSKFGIKGQIPYIKLNGEEIPDSNVILSRLRSDFGIDEGVSPAERAVGHAMMRMIEEHTTQIGFYYRYGLHMPDLLRVLDLPVRLFHADTSRKGQAIAYLWGRFQPGGTKKAIKSRRLGCHTDEELWAFSNDDLRAVSDYLGEKDFFLGEQPTTIDCVLFGHLVQFLYIPLDFPQKLYMAEECPNLIRFVERFREAHWKDWEDKCKETMQPPDTSKVGAWPIGLLMVGLLGVSVAVLLKFF